MTGFTMTQTELLYSMPVLPSAHSSFTTAVAVNNTTIPCEIPTPPWQPGYSSGYSHALQVYAAGGYETASTAPNYTFGLYADTTPGTALTSLAATGAFTMPTASVTTGTWILEATLTFSWTAATTWSVITTGKLFYGPGNNAATTAGVTLALGSSSAGVATPASLTTTTQYYLDLFFTSSASSATNLISCYQFMMFGCN